MEDCSQKVTDEMLMIFRMVDKDNSGRITADELQSALRNAQAKHFSDRCCKLMIALFDRDRNGTIDIKEFQQLYVYINQWLGIFCAFDKDHSGYIEEAELAMALDKMGYKFSSQFIKFLISITDTVNMKGVTVDEFIVICVQILRFTEAFRIRDTEARGVVTIDFEDFIKLFFQLSF